MFFYQAVIMIAVLLIICLLAYVIKLKNRAVLAVAILLLATSGALGLAGIQGYFGTKFSTQNVNLTELKKIKLNSVQKDNLFKIFSDYENIMGTESEYKDAVSKTYHISGNGTNSVIKVNILVYNSENEADNYFKIHQKFYDNKIYLPADDKMSLKTETGGQKFITSYIKSYYKDYRDIIYLPSKITYLSETLFEDENVIITIDETAGKPVTNKNVVFEDILKHLTNT